jgi:hypothetical protein
MMQSCGGKLEKGVVRRVSDFDPECIAMNGDVILT